LRDAHERLDHAALRGSLFVVVAVLSLLPLTRLIWEGLQIAASEGETHVEDLIDGVTRAATGIGVFPSRMSPARTTGAVPGSAPGPAAPAGSMRSPLPVAIQTRPAPSVARPRVTSSVVPNGSQFWPS